MAFSKFTWSEFIPESIRALREGYSFFLFKKDLIAGLTVGMIAIPMAMSYAIASGATPEQGLYTAIIGGFLVAALGGSRVQVAGPTPFFALLVYAIIQKDGYNSLCVSMVIAGLLLIGFGFSRIGNWVKYIPTSVIIGSTCGIALTIFSLQIADFLGLTLQGESRSFIENWRACYKAFPQVNIATTCLGLGSLGLIAFIRCKFPKLPWGLIAIAGGAAVCFLFDLPVETVNSKFGKFPTRLPFPRLPSFDIPLNELPTIFGNGFILAFFIGVESLISALVGEGLKGRRPHSNCELVAQGISNLGIALFGGIPGSGGIPRTSTNAETGAQTPIAAIIHSLTILSMICLFSGFLGHIPLVTLSAVLIVVAYVIFEVKLCIPIVKSSFMSAVVLFSTCLLTVFMGIQMGVFIGTVLTAFVFIHRTSLRATIYPSSTQPEVYKIEGPLFFGTINLLEDLSISKVFILDMHSVSIIDSSGMFALEKLSKECKKKQSRLLVCGVHGSAKVDFDRLELAKVLGQENVFPDLESALAHI